MSGSTAPAATILVVEPNVLVRMVLADYLRSCGYKVVEAAGSDEARLILEKGDVKVDVALIELDLPGATDGFTLARWIRTNRPSIKIQLAGTISKATAAAADLCDEGSVLETPYDHQLLVDRIKRLLAASERKEKEG
jgi:CheY-like chemotaxis protein